MILMMLVSLTALGQYPATKMIKGEQVVIMTVKQADDINTKFDLLEDSIRLASKKVNIVQANNKYLLDSIKNLKYELNESNASYRYYQNEASEYRHSLISLNRAHSRDITGILASVVLFIAVLTFHIKNQ